jgi:hypothetical protein
MRIELRIGLLLNSLSIFTNLFKPLPDFLNEFGCGFFMALAIFFFVVNMLPKKVYDNLLYRKLLTKVK